MASGLSLEETIGIFKKIRDISQEYLSSNYLDDGNFSNECIERISLIIHDEFYRIQNAAIDEVSSLISRGEFKAARRMIARHRKDGIDVPEFSVLEARMTRIELLSEIETET